MNCLSGWILVLLCAATVSADPMDTSANTHWELVTECEGYSLGQERTIEPIVAPVIRTAFQAPTEPTGGEWLWGQSTWFPSPKPKPRVAPLKDPVLTGRAGRVTSIHSRQPWAELRCDGQAVGRLGETVGEWEARMGRPTDLLSDSEVLFYQRALVDIGLFVKAGVVEKIVLAEPGQLGPLLKP